MEIYVPSVICWAYEAPRLLQLLQDVCTSCAACGCAAALEGCRGDQSSGLPATPSAATGAVMQACERCSWMSIVMLCMPAPATRALHTWQVSTDSHGWLQMDCTGARACGVRLGSLWSSIEKPTVAYNRSHTCLCACPRAHCDRALPVRIIVVSRHSRSTNDSGQHAHAIC